MATSCPIAPLVGMEALPTPPLPLPEPGLTGVPLNSPPPATAVFLLCPPSGKRPPLGTQEPALPSSHPSTQVRCCVTHQVRGDRHPSLSSGGKHYAIQLSSSCTCASASHPAPLRAHGPESGLVIQAGQAACPLASSLSCFVSILRTPVKFPSLFLKNT